MDRCPCRPEVLPTPSPRLSRPGWDQELSDLTMDEAEKGWLVGPSDTETLSATHGLWAQHRGSWWSKALSYVQSATTACVGAQHVIGIDPLLISAKAAMCAVTSDRLDEVVVEDATGRIRSAKLHADWRRAGTRRVLGKTWDLRSAYRNLVRTPSHCSVTIIAVWNPIAKKTEFYEQPVLPFGAASSVHSFCWVARSLYLVMSRCLWVLSGHYVDHFLTVEFAALYRRPQPRPPNRSRFLAGV